MGILDSKSRILDTILTLEGRRQIADGKLKVEWVSLSDSFTFYESDLVSGSTDATQRLFFEASHSPQDQITFEAIPEICYWRIRYPFSTKFFLFAAHVIRLI
jgi:hypothetical protein